MCGRLPRPRGAQRRAQRRPQLLPLVPLLPLLLLLLAPLPPVRAANAAAQAAPPPASARAANATPCASACCPRDALHVAGWLEAHSQAQAQAQAQAQQAEGEGTRRCAYVRENSACQRAGATRTRESIRGVRRPAGGLGGRSAHACVTPLSRSRAHRLHARSRVRTCATRPWLVLCSARHVRGVRGRATRTCHRPCAARLEASMACC